MIGAYRIIGQIFQAIGMERVPTAFKNFPVTIFWRNIYSHNGCFHLASFETDTQGAKGNSLQVSHQKDLEGCTWYSPVLDLWILAKNVQGSS